MKKQDEIFYSEILLLVNLCVALANGYITPLSSTTDELKTETTPALQQAATTTKKGAKGDQQPTATSAPTSGSLSTAVKNDDLKAALEVNHLVFK
jgi:hypothetical protein